MKRFAFVLLLGSTLSAVAFPVSSSAQQGGSLVQTILDGCPGGAFRSCVPTINAAIAAFPPGAQRNVDLIAVSVALAEIARRPQTPVSTCLDIAEGIRTAGQAVTSRVDSQALVELADSLCARGFETAGVGSGDSETPVSLVSGSTSQTSAPTDGNSGSSGGSGSGGSTGGSGDGGSGTGGGLDGEFDEDDGGGTPPDDGGTGNGGAGDGGSQETEFDIDDGGGTPPEDVVEESQTNEEGGGSSNGGNGGDDYYEDDEDDEEDDDEDDNENDY
jgi:hypothetical protein